MAETSARAETGRPFGVDDALALKRVSDPQISPEGRWVAFVVSRLDLEEDSTDSDIYMIPFEGGEAIRLTTSKKEDSRPRWGPDGRFLAFLSGRAKKSQVWLMNRMGGDPVQATELKGGVSSFEWSPDSGRLVLLSRDPDPDEPDEEKTDEQKTDKKKTPKPIVITRLQFKWDGVGYLGERRNHLYVFDLSRKEAKQITSGPYDDAEPAWSPDGDEIAFVSNRTAEPDSNKNTDIFLVPAGGGEPRRLTANPGPDREPAWSPDGKWISFVSNRKPELVWYATDHLAVVAAAGGEPRLLTASVDRNARRPRFSADGGSVYFLLEDSANQHLARIAATGGAVERVVSGEREIAEYHVGPGDKTALVLSEPHLPGEIFSLASAGPKKLSAVNDRLLSQVQLGAIENIRFRSKDGTEIEGFLTKPPDFKPGTRYPAVLWIHGGPVAQFSTGFDTLWQVLSGSGYLVVAANPRGSSGYGEAFSKAIWADWGEKDYQDVMAAVDHAIALGYADPERLGVGGWSYGGILTNYVLTKTSRFKAAVSGASETNYVACYGTDHYQHEWEVELGLPWENRDLYVRLSPLAYVKQIVTPTLILCGEKDFNVPLNQSEQLYQSLRRLGRDTALIIYPGESHSIRKPSYQKDRYQRYLDWYDRLLKGKSPKPTEAYGREQPVPQLRR